MKSQITVEPTVYVGCLVPLALLGLLLLALLKRRPW